MNGRPIVVALERGPASYAALRVAADLAAHLGVRLLGHSLVESATDTVRALRRLSLAAHRRGVEHAFVRPPEPGLIAASIAAQDAAVLVLGRAPERGAPDFRRRLLLGRVLRAPGPPVLVVPPRARGLGDLVLLVAPPGGGAGADALYALLERIAGRLVVVRPVEKGAAVDAPAALDRCLARARAWDERIQRDPEPLDEIALATARHVQPSLVAVASVTGSGRFAAAFAPGPIERLACDSSWPVLVARNPAVEASVATIALRRPRAGGAVA